MAGCGGRGGGAGLGDRCRADHRPVRGGRAEAFVRVRQTLPLAALGWRLAVGRSLSETSKGTPRCRSSRSRAPVNYAQVSNPTYKHRSVQRNHEQKCAFVCRYQRRLEAGL